jgi:hypothetical protein
MLSRVRQVYTAVVERKFLIALAVVAYVFCVFILPDLIFARSHVLYRDNINSNFNQRIQRFINEQIIVSCMPNKKELVLLDEHLTNEGHNFIYTARFAPKNQRQQTGMIKVMELGTGGIEVQDVVCPWRNRTVSSENPPPTATPNASPEERKGEKQDQEKR